MEPVNSDPGGFGTRDPLRRYEREPPPKNVTLPFHASLCDIYSSTIPHLHILNFLGPRVPLYENDHVRGREKSELVAFKSRRTRGITRGVSAPSTGSLSYDTGTQRRSKGFKRSLCAAAESTQGRESHTHTHTLTYIYKYIFTYIHTY